MLLAGISLKTYYEKTRPIIKMYEEKGMVVEVDAAKSKSEVYEAIKKELNLPMVRKFTGKSWKIPGKFPESCSDDGRIGQPIYYLLSD